MKYYLKREDGAAMFVAIMVVFVLAILGTALWQYSISDTIHVAMDEKRMQAYYVARAGADAGLQAWKDARFLAKPSGVSDSVLIENENFSGSFILTISNHEEKTVIESVGTVDDVSQKVTVTVTTKYLYGHELDWYNETGGTARFYGGIHSDHNSVILGPDASTGIFSNNGLINPADGSVTLSADSLFFSYPLNIAQNEALIISAKLIVFYEDVQLDRQIDSKGQLYIRPLEGKEETIVFFPANIFYRHGNITHTLAIAGKAYRVTGEIRLRDFVTNEDVNENEFITLIDPQPPVPSPFGDIDVIWN